MLRTREVEFSAAPPEGGGGWGRGGALPAEERQLCALSPGRHHPGLDLKEEKYFYK